MEMLWDILKSILKVAVLIALIVYIYFLFQEREALQDRLDKAEQVTAEQAQDIDYMQEKLNTNKEQAKETITIIKEAQQNQIPPTTHITVQAPSLPDAVQQTTERIQEQDPTLPPEALEETDKTIVAPQPDNEEYQVGVYKIDLQKDWSVGTGLGVHNGDVYVPVSVSRQYDNNKAVEVQVNLDPSKNMKLEGVQVMHKWYF